MPLKWQATLLQIKNVAEKILKYSFNSCLLNYYENGEQSMGWHCDNEKELYLNKESKVNQIASVSFGAMRRFDFRHKRTKDTISINLESGSLFWKHQVSNTKKVQTGRINLSFRNIYNKNDK